MSPVGSSRSSLHDYVIPEGCVYKGDESGRLQLEKRPIILRLLADAAASKFDAVAFYRLDRMARKLKYMLELWDRFDALGIKVLICHLADVRRRPCVLQ